MIRRFAFEKLKSPANKGVPCSEEKKAKLSKRFTGTRWMNNGVIQKQVQSIDIEQYLSEGFVFGRLKIINKEGDDNCENT